MSPSVETFTNVRRASKPTWASRSPFFFEDKKRNAFLAILIHFSLYHVSMLWSKAAFHLEVTTKLYIKYKGDVALVHVIVFTLVSIILFFKCASIFLDRWFLVFACFLRFSVFTSTPPELLHPCLCVYMLRSHVADVAGLLPLSVLYSWSSNQSKRCYTRGPLTKLNCVKNPPQIMSAPLLTLY
jgi:hypothetical protein